MKKILIMVAILTCIAAYSYCEENKAVNKSPFAFVQGFVMGDDYVQYQSDLAKAEDSYKKGEMSKEKYLELKSDIEMNFKAKKH